jgi:hypothetical protein
MPLTRRKFYLSQLALVMIGVDTLYRGESYDSEEAFRGITAILIPSLVDRYTIKMHSIFTDMSLTKEILPDELSPWI